MKRKIFFLSLILLVAAKSFSQVLIIGPDQANTNDVSFYQADLSYDPCHYGYTDLFWNVTGGTILSQSLDPNGLVYVQVQWTVAPGNPAQVQLSGASAPPPPGYPAYCFETGPQLLATKNVTIGVVEITPAYQNVPWYGANAVPICVTMPGVTIYSYQWRESSGMLGPWTNLNEFSSCLQVNNVTMLMYYSCELQTSAGTFYSPSAYVNYLELEAGVIWTQNPTPPYNWAVSILSNSPATGGYCSGVYQYAWEQSVENGPWVQVGTGVNYPGSLNIVGKTLVRRKVTCGINTLYSNTLTLYPVYTPVDFENLNYIREITVQIKGIQSWYHADAQAVGDKWQSTTYLDGLGRPVQKVEKGISPGSGTWKDMVTHLEYDEAGRETKKFIPYSTADNPGKYKTNAATAQPATITAFFGEPANAPTFGGVVFDNSPLNQVIKSLAPGISWGGANAGVTSLIDFNKDVEKVHIWTLAYTPGALPATSAPAVYPTGTLFRNSTTDEKGNQVITYADLSGNVILKKVQEKGVGQLSVEHYGWSCTYYVYDDLNRLRYIISPKAVDNLDNNGWSLTQPLADELCHRYTYDENGRIIVAKQPGAGEVKSVYDKKSRLVLTQKANQDKTINTSLVKSKWSFTLYDDLNRKVATGLLENDASQSTMQGYVNNLSNGVVSISAFVGAGNQSVQVEYPVAGGSSTGDYLPGNSNIVFNSILHYDNYNYTGIRAFNNTYTLAYTASVTIDATTNTARTTGMTTGLKTRVLDGDNNNANDKFLYSTSYYDETGRLIEYMSDNIKMYNGSGVDYDVSQYNFAGKMMSVFSSQRPAGAITYIITSKNEYDLAGRLTRISKNYNNSFYKQLAEYAYDEMGQLKTKRLAPGYTASGGNEIELLSYSYNIRGWLTGINKDYVLSNNNYSQWDRYFGIYLGYDNRDNAFGSATQLNGNLTGTAWRSQGDNTPRLMDYYYDALNRLVGAYFRQRKKPSDNVWSSAEVDFSTTIEYEDLNGNLKSMKHMGVIPGQNSGVVVDDLRYAYLPTGIATLNGNKLKQVDDLGTLGVNNGLLGDFKEANAVQDYYYDANGNMVKDLNKNIKDLAANGITYNYLDKPEKIIVEGKSTIEFTYNGAGVKLSKKVTYADLSTRLTTYIGDYVYENFTPAGGGGQGELLQFILHEEGRLKIITPHAKAVNVDNDYDLNAGSFGINNWPGGRQGVFEYFIKDHLSNTRLVLTEEVQKEYYKATMEAGAALQEEPLFGQVDANGNATAANELQKTRHPYTAPGQWPGNTTDVVKLTALTPGKTLGPNMVMRVMAGDIIQSNVGYYYVSNNSSGAGDLLNVIGNSFVNAMMGAQSSALGKNQSSAINANLTGTFQFTEFINHNGSVGSAPKAYLNIAFFDEQFKFVEGDPVTTDVGSRFARVNTANSPSASLTLQQRAPKNGWVFIYLSNESDEPVYFDNLMVTQEHSRISEENHYYPFGLKIAGISSKAMNKLGNKYNFQGDFSEEEAETGLDEFQLRMYDPQTGRWTGMDPFDEFASPYVGMGNNPVLRSDPTGGITWPVPIITGAVIGGVVGALVAENNGKPWYEGAIMGSIGGAAVGVAVSYFTNLAPVKGSPAYQSWDIVSSPILTAGVNMLSKFAQGDDYDRVFRSGLVGLGAGLAGTVTKYLISEKALESMDIGFDNADLNFYREAFGNLVTSGLNGMLDRTITYGAGEGYSFGKVLLHGALGLLEGVGGTVYMEYISGGAVKDPKNTFPGLRLMGTTAMTSVPGMGLRVTRFGVFWTLIAMNDVLEGNGLLIAAATVPSAVYLSTLKFRKFLAANDYVDRFNWIK